VRSPNARPGTSGVSGRNKKVFSAKKVPPRQFSAITRKDAEDQNHSAERDFQNTSSSFTKKLSAGMTAGPSGFFQPSMAQTSTNFRSSVGLECKSNFIAYRGSNDLAEMRMEKRW
jgi:hypothetical protein